MYQVLMPIQSDQIDDAITGNKPDISEKKRLIDDNKVLSVNATKVYHAYTEGVNIYYYLRRRGGELYYYPIAFAYVEITDKKYWEYEMGWDSAGNCKKCGEAGQCKCSHKRVPVSLLK